MIQKYVGDLFFVRLYQALSQIYKLINDNATTHVVVCYDKLSADPELSADSYF